MTSLHVGNNGIPIENIHDTTTAPIERQRLHADKRHVIVRERQGSVLQQLHYRRLGVAGALAEMVYR